MGSLSSTARMNASMLYIVHYACRACDQVVIIIIFGQYFAGTDTANKSGLATDVQRLFVWTNRTPKRNYNHVQKSTEKDRLCSAKQSDATSRLAILIPVHGGRLDVCTADCHPQQWHEIHGFSEECPINRGTKQSRITGYLKLKIHGTAAVCRGNLHCHSSGTAPDKFRSM